MNLYFLVEGKKTEPKIYPQWLTHLLPNFSQIKFADEATKNNYYLISGKGSPRILTVELPNAVAEINQYNNYDYLVFVIDADDMSTQEKTLEIETFIQTENIVLNSSCQLQIITQKYCIETWFLGNRKVYPRNTNNIDFLSHAQFYDVSQQDPELMQKPSSFIGSTSIYHENYLRRMLAAKNSRYSKSYPKEVGEQYYLEALQQRVNQTSDLSSLKNFFNFCGSVLSNP